MLQRLFNRSKIVCKKNGKEFYAQSHAVSAKIELNYFNAFKQSIIMNIS